MSVYCRSLSFKHPDLHLNSCAFGQVDFFAVELLDGSLYLLLDMGSGTIKVKSTQTKVNDGAWYHVDIQRDGRSGQSCW